MARATTHPGGVVTDLLGDGSYLMLNSELYSAAFAGHPFVAVVCDNGGYAVIHRLQTGQGADGFNNLLDDCAGPGAAAGLRVDFAAHAAALGCHVEEVAPDGSADDLAAAYARAQGGRRRAAPARGGRLPDASDELDRGRGLVGGRRARRDWPADRRTTRRRRASCDGWTERCLGRAAGRRGRRLGLDGRGPCAGLEPARAPLPGPRRRRAAGVGGRPGRRPARRRGAQVRLRGGARQVAGRGRRPGGAPGQRDCSRMPSTARSAVPSRPRGSTSGSRSRSASGPTTPGPLRTRWTRPVSRRRSGSTTATRQPWSGPASWSWTARWAR